MFILIFFFLHFHQLTKVAEYYFIKRILHDLFTYYRIQILYTLFNLFLWSHKKTMIYEYDIVPPADTNCTYILTSFHFA